MEIEYTLLLNHKDIFGDEMANISIEDLLVHIPKEYSVRIALLLSNTTSQVSAGEMIKTLNLDRYIHPKIIRKLLERPDKTVFLELASCQTGLELLKYIYSIPTSDFKTSSDFAFGNFALLIAILKINNILLGRSAKYGEDASETFTKSIQYRKYEVDSRIGLYSTGYRALRLHSFLKDSQIKDWSDLAAQFASELGFSTFSEYLLCVDSIVEKIPFAPSKSNIIFRLSAESELRTFINRFSIDLTEILPLGCNVDYTAFKERPFIKITDNEYGVISNKFVSNLFYTSVRFKLSKISRELGIIKNFPSSFNTDFVQDYLMDGLIHYIYDSRGSMIFTDKNNTQVLDLSGCQNKKNEKSHYDRSNRISPPDAYIRSEQNIILIECKGLMLSIKALTNYGDCISVINKNLIGSHGTGQLKRNIERILNRTFLWDYNIPTDYTIYPILLVDDYSFSADGFNKMLLDSIRKEWKTFNSKIVRPVTVIDMDTLILAADYIKSGTINLCMEIDAYHDYCKHRLKGHKYTPEEIIHCDIVSFSIFLMSRYELKSPEIMNNYRF